MSDISIPYADSFLVKKELGWKEKGKDRERIYLQVYKTLLPKLFDRESPIIVVGPSNEEIKYIQEIKKRYEIIIFEPDKNRVEEIRKILIDSKVINDFVFNIGKYFPPRSVYGVILLNVINWVPTNTIELFEEIYKCLCSDGKLILSFYIEIFSNAKDEKYLVKTPPFFKNLLNKFSSFKDYYSDSNGFLEFCIISKGDLAKIVKALEKRYRRLKEELKFFSSTLN